ncbi:MAG: asparagine--tRNA ligase [candidate division Zixibacteria bacterium]|nr:asparagine--tRNA ligase [candidate division Zixibacteria bacterium]
MTECYIEDIGKHVGEQVTLKGWVYNTRSSGKVRFIIFRDGTGMIQAVLAKGETPEEDFAKFDQLTQESSIIISGPIKEEPRAEGEYEMMVKKLEIIQVSTDYPITPKEHSTGFLMANRHLWLRSTRQYHILRVRNEIIQAIRQYFYERGYVLIDTPILTGSIGEGASTLFETQYFDLGKAYLAQTGQLYLEAACMSHGKVYCFGPTFRAEKSKTRRHLTEFWMIEAEVAYMDLVGDMDLQEDMLCYVVEWVLDKASEHLVALERDLMPLLSVKKPFHRISYDEAVPKLQGAGSQIQWGDDLGGEDETILTKMYDRPIFVYNYPRDAKAFYMKRNPENPRTVLCADLLAPEGYGEIIGGSQREDNYDYLVEAIQRYNLPLEPFGWYLDLRKYGSVPHSGFGLGVERTVAWLCGLPHLRETIPFARTLYRLYP